MTLSQRTKPSTVKSRPRKRRFMFVTFAVLAVAAAGYAGIERPWEIKPRLVMTETVQPAPVLQALAVNGRVAAKQSVSVRSAISGRAISIGADVGDRVEQGAPLVQIDTALIDVQVEQARAALAGQQARQEQAQIAFDRAKALGSNTTRSALENAEIDLRAAMTETARLQAAFEQAELQVAQYLVDVPMSGTVMSRSVEKGQLVDPQTVLFVIAETSDLLVETDVDELYSARVKTGLKALLQPVGASVQQNGTVVFAAPSVDTSTGGRAIKISFDEPVELPVGQTVNANVIIDEFPDAISVPRGAIVSEGASSQVMIIVDDVATARPIKFNDWPAERVIVTEGLAGGDVVILDPSAVAPGDAVAAQD